MTDEDVARGNLVVLLGVATVQPEEFVTLRVAVRVRPGVPRSEGERVSPAER
jgi:hypothetical protein